LSYSRTDGDKWEGPGDSGRDNAMLGLAQPIGSRIKTEVYAVYNNAQVHTYRPLRYSQAAALSVYNDMDYNDNPSDYFYHGYNLGYHPAGPVGQAGA
jgi:iron complex outermembrane receptor protein